MPEQGGIYKITLVENNNLNVAYSDATTIQGIGSSGETIELTDCENNVLNYKDKMFTGANDLLMHDYEITLSIFDLELTTFDILDDLSSIFGFSAILYFRNGEDKVLLSPLFLENSFDYNELNTQVFNIMLSTQVSTNEKLYDYEPIISGGEILAETGFSILAEDSSPILTE